ncbi:MAG: hypothetical protein LQ352_001084 [Teloschistes flavicans]|nr:MAG: hypothetical protein LQ352_001084 [Teloschistes flavicans]
MGLDVSSKDHATESNHAPHNASEKPIKKKRSLTRLFTASRSSSRSRPSSVDESEIPSTPTIPDQFLPTSRKASRCETPPFPGDGAVHTVQPVLADITNTANTTSEPSEPLKSDLKGILKPRTYPAKVHTANTATESKAASNVKASNCSPTPNASHKRRKEKTTPFPSPILSDTQEETNENYTAIKSESPHTRARGASAVSFRKSSLLDPSPNNIAPSRPSTSGGERKRATAKDINSGSGGHYDLGLDLDSWPQPTVADGAASHTSLRSAITTASSFVDCGTARSSVVTKSTSLSDMTVDSYTKDTIDEGMTVDEAIGMYEHGFADDTVPDQDIPSSSSTNEEERRRSARLAEAINDTIGSNIGSNVLSTGPAPGDTATSPLTNTLRDQCHGPPSITPPTTTRDQYGFLKAGRYVSVEQYDTWNRLYAPDQIRRSQKWFTYMREQGCASHFPTQFPDRSPKTLRYVRKGIPPAWRGASWFYYSGGARLQGENPNTYSSLMSRLETSELSSNDVESIERDLHRTFPDNIHFKPDHPAQRGCETTLLSSLRRVLQAFAVYRPQIGYCQSLNFLAGLLLLFLPEEKTFWMLHIITTDHLPGTHELSLEGANVDLWVLMFALKESSPSIWAKVGVGGEDVGSIQATRLPPISLCTTSWFMSMFIGTLPIESVLRVWDVIFYEGSKMLFRIALAIFKMGEQRIKDVHDSMELFQVVQGLPRAMLDIGPLMSLASRRGGISQDWITKKRKDRRKWYAKEKAKVTGTAMPLQIGRSPLGNESPDLNRANSAWRKRVGLVK